MPKHRAHGDGEIRKRPDGRWEARLRLPDGKRKSLYGKTRRDVQIKLKQLNRDIDRGLDVTNEKLLVKDYLASWLESEKDSLRPSTWQNYESYLGVHILPAFGHIRLRHQRFAHQ